MSPEIMNNFYESLDVLVKGMGGIFAVLGIIYLMIKTLIKVFPEK